MEATSKQYLAIIHLAAGATIKEAASAVGCSESSIEKWKRNKNFDALLREAIRKIYDSSIAELSKGAMEACNELRRIISSPDSSDRVKLTAIQILFGQLEKARGWELEDRVERIEDFFNGRQSKAETN